MKLAKKARIRAKQMRRNGQKFQAMSAQQIDAAFDRVYIRVKKLWAKKGFNF